MPDAFSFRLLATDGAARRGEIATPHGLVATPAFMPVGTQATVKGLPPEAVRASGTDILLGNTYHLMLRPGADRIAALGGLHRFMNWPHAILTDSGGFQVMSLSELRKVEDKGVTFRSHLDGALVELTPERAVEIQTLLGSDIAMQLDECLKLPAPHRELDPELSLPYRPYHRHQRRLYLTPGEIVRVEVEIWPTSMVFRKGHRIRLDIQPRDGVGSASYMHYHADYNTGTNTIHAGGDKESYLLLPVIPARNA